MAKKRRTAPREARAEHRAPSPAQPSPSRDGRPGSPDWRWRTFPVFFAFAVGLLAASFMNGSPNTEAGAVTQIVALLAVGYGLAHLFVTNVIVAGRIKRRRQALERGETPAGDFEDELVYPDDEPPPPRG
ncbi:MAG TPA: hypothetical protein VEZ14_08685 [Dehalococcoidia bacterium]|nr:hypothetical protein [Dehalococcoidia bacterium]